MLVEAKYIFAYCSNQMILQDEGWDFVDVMSRSSITVSFNNKCELNKRQ